MLHGRTQHAKDFGILKNTPHSEGSRTSSRDLEFLDGVYFHFLVPASDEESELGSDEWEGRHMSLKRTITAEAQKNEKVLKGEIHLRVGSESSSYQRRYVLQCVKRIRRI